MSQYLSDKLKVLSLFSMMLVLCVHSGFHELEGNVAQEFLSGMMGRCAVPLSYVISGWLFFRLLPYEVKSVWQKMKKRVRTLLVPYIIGCVLCVGFSVSVMVAVAPGTSRFINGSIMPLFDKSFGDILCSAFYAKDGGLPIAYQLWFLRDLILIVTTAPLWYYALRYLGWGFVAIVFALTYLHLPHVPISSLFWFSLGGQLTTIDIESSKIIRGGWLLLYSWY